MDNKKKSKFNLFVCKYVQIYLFFSLVINGLSWFIAYYIATNINSDSITLHYSVNIGPDSIGEVKRIYTIPILGLIIISINLILSFCLYKKGNFMINSLLLSGLVSNIFLLIAMVALYLFNF